MTHAPVMVGSLTAMPIPPSPDPDLLTLWRRHVPNVSPSPPWRLPALAAAGIGLPGAGPTPDGEGDYEDWTEMACRLRALLDAGADETWLSWGGNHGRAFQYRRYPASPGRRLRATGTDVDVDDVVAWIAEGSAVHFGPLQDRSPLLEVCPRLADRYYLHPAFARYAHRPTVLCGIDAEDEPLGDGASLTEVMAEHARCGYDATFVKARQAKRGVWTVPCSTDPSANEAALFEAMDWDVVYFSGRRDALLAQPRVDMEFEYRVFVVDGHPITGAGCVESATPLDNTSGEAFSALVEKSRGDGLPHHDPRIAREAHALAVEVTADVSDDLGRAYVVDVAKIADPTKPTEAPAWGVVEFNGVDNAGLYASDPRLLIRALTA